MYDAFWQEITEAPVPPPKSDMSEQELRLYRQAYRAHLAERVSPLTRHAIRYWELTLTMVERTGVDSEWTARIREQLEHVRARLLHTAQGTRIPVGDESVARR